MSYSQEEIDKAIRLAEKAAKSELDVEFLPTNHSLV